MRDRDSFGPTGSGAEPYQSPSPLHEPRSKSRSSNAWFVFAMMATLLFLGGGFGFLLFANAKQTIIDVDRQAPNITTQDGSFQEETYSDAYAEADLIADGVSPRED